MNSFEINEVQWDRLLRIKTSGRDDSNADNYRYPYEPTPYCVLERLARTGDITKRNMLIDYGCGKGRVSLFMSYQTRCRSAGIEYDERIFRTAEANRISAASGARVCFYHCAAETFDVTAETDRCFFFNPFSVQILAKVLSKLRKSYFDNPREIILYFYYPSDEYTGYLSEQDYLIDAGDIDCRDLFPGDNPRERIAVYKML